MGSLLRSRLAGVALASLLLALSAAGCAGDRGQTATLDDCLRDFPAGFRSSLAPEQSRYISDDELTAASRPLCRELVRRDSEVSEDGVGSVLTKVVQAKPETWQPLCDLTIDATFEALGPGLAYVSNRERERFRTDACRLVVQYIRPDGTVDQAAFLADHSVVYTPFCAEGLQHSLASDRAMKAAFSRRALGEIARRTCSEALRRRVIDMTGPGGVANPAIDQVQLAAIFDRAARDVGRS
jgi:hypothetical protein